MLAKCFDASAIYFSAHRFNRLDVQLDGGGIESQRQPRTGSFQTRRIVSRHYFGMKWNENADLQVCKLLILWWPGTESNRRRQPSIFPPFFPATRESTARRFASMRMWE